MTANKKSDREELFKWADQIPSPLWHDLLERPAKDAAASVGGIVEDGIIFVHLLGVNYRVDPKHRLIHRKNDDHFRVGFQTGIVLLTSLAKSMGVPPSGRMVTPQELKGGRFFFTGAHNLSTKPLAERYGNDPEGLISRALELGGERYQAADYGVRLPGLPVLPLYVLLWIDDNEFNARAVIGIDDRALFHLDLAGVFALTNIMVNRLTVP